MVGRLVKDERVDARVDQLRQRQSSLLAAGKRGNRLENVVAGEEKPPQKSAQLAVGHGRRGAAAQFFDRGVAVVDDLQALVVVADVDACAPTPVAVERLLFTQDGSQQRGLAHAVAADDPQPFAAPQQQRQAARQRLCGEAYSQFIEDQNLVARARRRFEFEIGGLLIADVLQPLHSLEKIAARFGLLRLLAREVAADELLGASDHLLLLAESAPSLLAALLLLDEVVAVIAPVSFDPPVFEVEDAVDRVIEEEAVVRDDQIGRFVTGQKVFQPLDGLDVQMVRRLVEQQYVGFEEQQPRQPQSILLSTRQIFGAFAEFVLREPQAEQHGLGARVVAESALMLVS